MEKLGDRPGCVGLRERVRPVDLGVYFTTDGQTPELPEPILSSGRPTDQLTPPGANFDAGHSARRLVAVLAIALLLLYPSPRLEAPFGPSRPYHNMDSTRTLVGGIWLGWH